MTNIKSKAYQPQVVSLGPFHHGDRDLRPMEEHKHRALRQLLLRANRPLDNFVAAVEEVVEELEGAYMDLDTEWRADGGGRERFLAMMIFDGCFLLEVMRCTAADGKQVGDYAHNDPIFSPHGILYMVPYIRRDVLMLENQLPLLLLQKLVEVESGKPSNDDFINRMVLKFLAQSSGTRPAGIGLGLHPLDVFRRSMLTGKHHKIRSPQDIEDDNAIIRSAVELYEAGIQFKPSKTLSLHDIRFRRGTLSMPTVSVDDSTEYMFLNMMAFERLHAGAGNDVTGYVFFMDNIIDSAKDVALLSSKGIIQNAIGSDQAVGPGGRNALDDQTVARVACGTQQRAVEQRAVAGVLYKRATESGGDHGDREHCGDLGDRESGGGKIAVEGAAALRSPSAPSSMSSSSSRTTSRMQSPARVEMPIFVCPLCRAGVDQRVSHTPKNHNRPFYMCSENGVRIGAIAPFLWSVSLSNELICLAFMQVQCFFLWVDALAKTLTNELQEEHEEWLPMLPRTAVAAAGAPQEETEGKARDDRELAFELRMLKKKVRKLEDQAHIPICNYFWAFVGMVIALAVMLKLYGKA
uniref:Uncharacterized protein n=1 Tax=Aegilops tauschii TaxID=37682 RepID=M8BT24_AEGTA